MWRVEINARKRRRAERDRAARLAEEGIGSSAMHTAAAPAAPVPTAAAAIPAPRPRAELAGYTPAAEVFARLQAGAPHPPTSGPAEAVEAETPASTDDEAEAKAIPA